MIRVVITYLRSIGLKVTVFVDDFLLAAKLSCITDAKDKLLHTLSDLGFLVNLEKCCLIPSKTIKYIGYTIDSSDNKIIVKAQAKHVVKLKHCIRRLIQHEHVFARELAQVLGQCISIAWAVTPGKLFLRNAYWLLGTRSSW